MEGRNRIPDLLSADDVEAELRDDPHMLGLFRQLPASLRARHFQTIQKIAKSAAPEEARRLQVEHMIGVLAAREEAIVEYASKDAYFQSKAPSEGEDGKRFQQKLRDLFVSEKHSIGSGQTARVKSLRMEGRDEPVAVKYLITPTEKTLSAEGEHDMLWEVEIVTTIEKLEQETSSEKYLRVPHPYFYFKRGSLQCYGMTQVNGVTAEQILAGGAPYNSLREEVISGLKRRYESSSDRHGLDAAITPFLEAMHKICLHGDIKPKNIMIDTNGVFYLIDFGQAVLANSETEKTREQFDNLRQLESDQVRECIKGVFNSMNRQDTAVAA